MSRAVSPASFTVRGKVRGHGQGQKTLELRGYDGPLESDCIGILALLLPGCVVLGKSLSFSGP